jgi:hypothetical protein
VAGDRARPHGDAPVADDRGAASMRRAGRAAARRSMRCSVWRNRRPIIPRSTPACTSARRWIGPRPMARCCRRAMPCSCTTSARPARPSPRCRATSRTSSAASASRAGCPERLRVPQECRDVAQLTARYHGTIHRAAELRPAHDAGSHHVDGRACGVPSASTWCWRRARPTLAHGPGGPRTTRRGNCCATRWRWSRA